MKENYYRLKIGENKEQYGIILRVREGELEELTGFCNPEKIGETLEETHYEMNVKTNGYGKLIGEEEIIGLMVRPNKFPQIEIFKQPKIGKGVISKIAMSEAAKILEDVQYLRDIQAYIGS